MLRRRKWSIAIVTLLVVGAAMAFTLRQTPLYTSQARVFVTPIGPGATTASLNLDTERALVDSVAVASIVQKRLHVAESPDSLLSDLSVSVEGTTDILDIDYTSPVPATAQKRANAFATAYLRFRQRQAVQQVQQQSSGIESEIAKTRTQLAGVESRLGQTTDPATKSRLSAERDAFIAQLGALNQQLETVQASVVSATGGQVVQPGGLPTTPSSPHKIRSGVLALVVGLALGIGVAFLRERLDDHLRGAEDLEEATQAPTLAVVPTVSDWKDRKFPELVSVVAPKSSPAEAYRALRTNLQFIGHTDDFRLLCVTSGGLGEGKTTTVANLGVTLGDAGRKVVLISCDLRRPRLHKFFGLANEKGLSSFLSGQEGLPDVIRRSPIAENVLVVPSGPVPPNPAELLASDKMAGLLEELREAADFVVIDTPPLFGVADALALAPKSDGTLLVADANSTTRAAARHARQQLDRVGARVVGVVLNNFDPWSGRYYGYGGYRYSYSYRYRYEDGEVDQLKGNGRPEKARRRRKGKDPLERAFGADSVRD